LFGLAVPLTIVFARVFASVFEVPFRRRRTRVDLRPTGTPQSATSAR
jgi:peptidoglycan/LPS O-acetylase OafA/YrhL